MPTDALPEVCAYNPGPGHKWNLKQEEAGVCKLTTMSPRVKETALWIHNPLFGWSLT